MTSFQIYFPRIYFPFAAAYLLSYLFRNVNAVISPELSRDLALNPSSLGLLTSTYFLAFGAAQLPVGMLLDRYGPRRVEPVLLTIAAFGALLFAYAETLPGLAIARAVIGLGVCACLMAPLKAISAWFPRERQASLSGWIMVAGGLGALAATTPLEMALQISGWRTIFVVLAAITSVVALVLAWRIPDVERPAVAKGFREQWAGVGQVLRHRRFWWIAPLGACCIGTFMAVQGLWAVPWLMEVEGHTRSEAARHLLFMGLVILAGYVLLGFLGTQLARRGIHARHLFVTGFALAIVALAGIFLRLPGGYFWWSLYGFGAAANVLGFTVLNEGFARELTGRTNTALNLMMFGGSLTAQYGIGVVAEAARARFGYDLAGGLRVALGIALAANVLAFLWFLRGWPRHARVTMAAPAN
ncbi:MAG: MFS transporter [Betaproteobacteria bacterium]